MAEVSVPGELFQIAAWSPNGDPDARSPGYPRNIG